MRIRAALTTAALCAVAVLGAVPAQAAHQATREAVQMQRDVVRTQGGSVRGKQTGTVRSFLGLPFAAPPVGALRWKPPTAPARWTGVRDATTARGFCAQPPSAVSSGASGGGGYNEDCLYLNVYTPAGKARTPRPVMVWIHGGSYTNGAGSEYDPSRIVAQAGTVVVTINYRLGPLGFLDVPALAGETRAGAGNYGLLDQQAALRWVKRNIASFGGDARNVTAFGESAGAGSVCANLTSPFARGLINKAIAESGCALDGPTEAAAQTKGRGLATSLGCPDADAACLRGKTAQQIIDTAGRAALGLSYAPTVGTPVLPRSVTDALAAGMFARVPLLQGTNHDEGRLFAAALGLIGNTSPQAYTTLVNVIAGTAAPKVLAEYPLASYGTVADAFSAVLTDGTFACPALRVNRATSRSNRTFGYEFNDPNSPLPSPPGFPFRAAHAAELPYLFTLGSGLPLPAAAQPLSREMIAYWTNFAARGNPNGPRTGYWPRFAGPQPRLQALLPGGSRPLAATTFAADHHCALWDAVPVS
jgi:para-nitrobenzyl esterase